MKYQIKIAFRIFTVFTIILLSGCIIKEKNQAKGTLERDRVALIATSNQIITDLPIAEGSQIKKGDILVKLDDIQQKAILAKAIAQQAQAKANLDKMQSGERTEDIAAAKANLDSAQAQLIDAQKNYERMVELVAQKYVSQASADNALTQKDAAQAAFDAANQNWKKLSQGYRQEDIDAAQATFDATIADVALQQKILDDLTVKATRDGILDSLPYNAGERVPTNAVVAIIEAATAPYARVYIPEPYVAKYTKGSEVTVHIDGIERPFKGVIRWISVEPSFTPYSNMSEEDRSRFVYLAEIDLLDDTQRIPAGIPVQVDME
ncbi:MAG: HlyD family secretion protein [Alphaproteobacteria bacterium]